MEIKNAVITSAKLSFAERGILEAWIHLDYGGSGQGFGGYALYLPQSYSHHEMESVCGHFLYRTMQVAGVEDWSNLVGRTIRVKSDHSSVQAIGHIVKDDWFDPSADFAPLRASLRR